MLVTRRLYILARSRKRAPLRTFKQEELAKSNLITDGRKDGGQGVWMDDVFFPSPYGWTFDVSWRGPRAEEMEGAQPQGKWPQDEDLPKRKRRKKPAKRNGREGLPRRRRKTAVPFGSLLYA